MSKTLECLNAAFAADSLAMHSLLTNRFACNRVLAQHPNVLVNRERCVNGAFSLSAFGLLNSILSGAGLEGFNLDWRGQVDSTDNVLVGFKVAPGTMPTCKPVDVLNAAFAADPAAMYCLWQSRVPCNKALADHPTIVVDQLPVDGEHWSVGLLGVVNGVLVANGLPKVAAVLDSDVRDDMGRAKLVGFCEMTEAALSPDCGADSGRKDLATKIAEAIEEEWSIGEFSRFCDDPPEFDDADTNEITAVIRKVLHDNA